MARQEADHDDLFSEAIALTSRALWKRIRPDHPANCQHSDDLDDPAPARLQSVKEILIGTRANDWLSIYWDQSWMVQFNEMNQLRRAYVEPCLYRAQGGTLSRLTRHRNPHETSLLRHDLNEAELHSFLASNSQQLTETFALLDCLESGEFKTFQLASFVHPIDSIQPEVAEQPETIHSTLTARSLVARLGQICMQKLVIAEPPRGRH
ncbi:hypothetical protein Plim_0534 [Planctopirus limnophila DSM 3776]|uniref:Uncharacterized protein n=2 Tax=Planctopirus limnophila TaxID=120 RepID=D5SQD0_PLAL2|nr:hypothetical protein Plim_0534 [Planctopirus limnophila DSM 3776]